MSEELGHLSPNVDLDVFVEPRREWLSKKTCVWSAEAQLQHLLALDQ